MQITSNDKIYEVCDRCGSFKSSNRCYFCKPLENGDLDVHDKLRRYYGIYPKTDIHKRIVKHHLLEYYFTQQTLMEFGLYFNVPEWQLLEVTSSKHHRIIRNMQLHSHLFEGTKEYYKNMTEQDIRKLIDGIPKEVIDTFKACI